MESAPSVKPRRGSPPIPPNYVSLRQLQELRLKEEEEKQRQEAEMEEKQRREAEMEEKQRREEAARKAEMEAVASAAAFKRDAARKPDSRSSYVRAKERRGGGPGAQWVPVAHRPAVPPPPLPPSGGEVVTRTTGISRGNKVRAHELRGGGGIKLKGKAKKGNGKEEVSAITSVQTCTDEPGKLAEASSLGGRPGNKASGGTSAEPGSIGGSGESAGASSRRRYVPKGRKGAGGCSAGPSPAGASPPQGVKPENAGNPKSPGPKRAGACPISDSFDGKKSDARTAPPTSAAAGGVCELRTTPETKPERLVEGHRGPPLLEDQGMAEQKPRVPRRRPRGDRCNGAKGQHGRVWVPKPEL